MNVHEFLTGAVKNLDQQLKEIKQTIQEHLNRSDKRALNPCILSMKAREHSKIHQTRAVIVEFIDNCDKKAPKGPKGNSEYKKLSEAALMNITFQIEKNISLFAADILMEKIAGYRDAKWIIEAIKDVD